MEPRLRAARPHRAVKPARAVEPGTLTLVTQPYARVLLRDRELGMTPLFNVSVPGGRQTLRLIGSDNQTRLLTVDVAPKRLTTVRVVLDSLPRGR
ncbi:MAG: hypothetical protein IPJ65_05840 [Archangiaceae bacterium]|nr:hypothetical protein [Archangiaceae bacterium]